jgi:hypothetical protein
VEERKAFYVKCRPDVDIIQLVRDEQRVFVGYPPIVKGATPDRHHMRSWLQDLSVSDAAGTPPLFDAERGYRQQVAQNRGFAGKVKPGDVVVVPRPGSGYCLIGTVASPFELVDDPPWGDRAVRQYAAAVLKHPPGSPEGEAQFLTDYVQTWSVSGWTEVPFPRIPRWISYRFLSRNTIGWIEDCPADGRTAARVLEEICRSPEYPPLPVTTDVAEVASRLLDWVAPAAFEHLVCDLLQLEYPQLRWWHVGGSGDGGADALAADQSGRVVAALQCKWKSDGDLGQLGAQLLVQLASGQSVAPHVWVATLFQEVGNVRQQPGVTLWGRRQIGELLLHHARLCPMARTLGLV